MAQPDLLAYVSTSSKVLLVKMLIFKGIVVLETNC
jgi:hypothetical protein